MRRWAWHFLGFRVFAESTIYGFYICGHNQYADNTQLHLAMHANNTAASLSTLRRLHCRR